MSFQTQWLLTYDDAFVSRCRACLTKQSDVYRSDGRPDIAALANSILRGDAQPITSFQSLLAASPGFDDSVDMGDGTIDSTKISDGDILSASQAEYPVVAALYFDSTGAPVT